MSSTSITGTNRVDSHQHFWEYDPQQYPWIQQDWPIRKSFLPEELKPLLNARGFSACIAVQARQTIEETEWLLRLADQHPFIAGVVGWADLRAENVAEQLQELRHPNLVGVRHVAQDEPDDWFLAGKDFKSGIAQLKDFDLAYDILVFPHQLPAAVELVRTFPDQRFVLDHIAKPNIREAQIEPWKTQIRELAKSPNVWCKLSGMVTEAKWRNWSTTDFRPYLDVVWEAFGEDRLMIGSDWPVCLLSGDYAPVMNVVHDYIGQFSAAGQEKVLGGNAIKFYKLKI